MSSYLDRIAPLAAWLLGAVLVVAACEGAAGSARQGAGVTAADLKSLMYADTIPRFHERPAGEWAPAGPGRQRAAGPGRAGGAAAQGGGGAGPEVAGERHDAASGLTGLPGRTPPGRSARLPPPLATA